MAIKTITLRPTGSDSYIVDGYDPATTTYPATSDVTKVYLLINEDNADGDGTYIKIASVPGASYSFTVPDEYIGLTPTAMRLYVNIMADTASDITFAIEEPDDTAGYIDACSVSAETAYNVYIVEPQSDDMSLLWGAVIGDESVVKSPGLAMMGTAQDSAVKETTIKLTQFYIEADFDVDESSGIYVRKNGAFVEVAQMYQKVNGAWTEITAEECKSLIQSHS